MVNMVNTTNTTYEAIGLVPQTTYLFELQPIFGDTVLQVMSREVMLERVRKFSHTKTIVVDFSMWLIHSSS